MNRNYQILANLKNYLRRNFGKCVADVILFGSRARNDSDEFSDYDVLIILDSNYSTSDENRILDLCYDIDLKYDILLDVHILSVSEIDSLRGRQPIFQNAIKYGIYA
ncbi:MAG: nucleotidyltransferase domain-containing protein [Candidatus Kapaibacterium sp.]